MTSGKPMQDRSWVDGQFTVRLRGPGTEPGRIIRLRRPFALIGRIPGADIRIDDPAVDDRHALLILDERGIFGVDLRSRTGTRFAGLDATASWLGAGDILEVAGRRVELLQLRIDGTTIDPPLANDDLLGDDAQLVDLTLEPTDASGPTWMIGSALALIGSGDACAIRIESPSASSTHCALMRGRSAAHVIDLCGGEILINDQHVDGTAPLHNGDLLEVGQVRFNVSVGSANLRSTMAQGPNSGRTLARVIDPQAVDPRSALVEFLVEQTGANRVGSNQEILETLRQFQADAATLLEAQMDRIEAMNREITALRSEVRAHLGPPPAPVEPIRLDLIPPSTFKNRSSTWLLEQLGNLEAEQRSTWKDLLGRIRSTIASGSSSTDHSIVRTSLPGTTTRSHS